MAAPRNGDGAVPKRGHSSRRSYSSSPARSPPAPSRSPSPRSQRLRRAQEDRDSGRPRSMNREHGRENQRITRNRDRDRDRNRERDKDVDRVRARSRDRDYGRGRNAGRDEERLRDRRGREREPEGRSRERSRDRRGRGGERAGEKSPIRSPIRRRDRSLSAQDLHPRHRHSPSRSRSPARHQTSFKHDQRANNNSTGTSAAARDEDGDDAIRERTRGEDSPQQDDAVVRMQEVEAALAQKETNKEKPSFEYSGKLAAETNKVKGVTLQFTEPPEARKPNTRWRLYVFKDGEPLNDPLYIHRQTCYLFGRERRVADIPTDHPSCSKQHAVIQYRLTDKEEADGMISNKVRPYVMDLGSTNGTMLNSDRLDPQRYYEMFEKDTLKFGNSSDSTLGNEGKFEILNELSNQVKPAHF